MLKTNDKIEAFVNSFVPPEGFTKSIEEHETSWWKEKHTLRKLVIENKQTQVKFEVYCDVVESKDEYNRKEYGEFQYSGHTTFVDARGGHRTFDRTGVEDSFYGGELSSLSEILNEQLQRIAKAVERSKNTINLPKPVSGWTRTKEEIEQIKKELQAKKPVSFYPSGFGTGYVIRNWQTRFSNKAPELAKFLGFDALYYETLDCD